jgi:hypothetical protein
MGYQIHIPPHRSQQRQRRSAKLTFSRLWMGHTSPHPKSQATFPFPSGHILQGRRINRSDPRRPAVPKRHPRAPGKRPGGVDAGLPAVPAPRTSKPNTPTVRHQSSRPLTFEAAPTRLASQESKADPSHTCAESKADPSHRPLAPAVARPLGCGPPDQTP